jgi:hypothetical protein
VDGCVCGCVCVCVGVCVFVCVWVCVVETNISFCKASGNSRRRQFAYAGEFTHVKIGTVECEI